LIETKMKPNNLNRALTVYGLKASLVTFFDLTIKLTQKCALFVVTKALKQLEQDIRFSSVCPV